MVYCVELNELFLFNNEHNLDLELKMFLITLGLRDEYTLEYIGEL